MMETPRQIRDQKKKKKTTHFENNEKIEKYTITKKSPGA